MQRYVPSDRKGGLFFVAMLTLVMLCLFVGLAVDLGLWYRTTRAMRSAAEAAVRAAARDGGGTYQRTGKATAAQLGFVDGRDGVTVKILSNQRCADGHGACYEATIDDATAPRYFSRMIGLSAPRLSISATIAMTPPTVR